MENTVLGNALEGVPEESEEEEQPTNSNIESANNLDGQFCFKTNIPWKFLTKLTSSKGQCFMGRLSIHALP